jgi:hypothetical protein
MLVWRGQSSRGECVQERAVAIDRQKDGHATRCTVPPSWRQSLRSSHEGGGLSARAIFVDRWLKGPVAIRPTGITTRSMHGTARSRSSKMSKMPIGVKDDGLRSRVIFE